MVKNNQLFLELLMLHPILKLAELSFFHDIIFKPLLQICKTKNKVRLTKLFIQPLLLHSFQYNAPPSIRLSPRPDPLYSIPLFHCVFSLGAVWKLYLLSSLY